MVGKQHLSAGWQELEWGIRTKGRIFERAYGEPFFQRCAKDMSIEDTYSKGMSALDHTCKPRLNVLWAVLVAQLQALERSRIAVPVYIHEDEQLQRVSRESLFEMLILVDLPASVQALFYAGRGMG